MPPAGAIGTAWINQKMALLQIQLIQKLPQCQQAVLGSHTVGTMDHYSASKLQMVCHIGHTAPLYASCALLLCAYCTLAFCAPSALTLYASMCCGTSASLSWSACSYGPKPQQTCLAAMLSCHVCLWATPLPSLLLPSTREILLPAPVYQMSRVCQLLLSTRNGRQGLGPVGLLVSWQAKQLPMGADTMTAVQLLHRPCP